MNKFCEVYKLSDMHSHTPGHAHGMTGLKLLPTGL